MKPRIIQHGKNRFTIITNPQPAPPPGAAQHRKAARRHALAEQAGLLYALLGIPLPEVPDDPAFQYALREARAELRRLG